MIAEWVLIIMLFASREATVTAQTFSSYERCEKAIGHIKDVAKFIPTTPRVYGICVER